MSILAKRNFDFLSVNESVYTDVDILRLELRHKFIIDEFKPEIAGATVLDLASHDGRWPWAFAKAGAKTVLGIEGRKDLIDRFSAFPDDDAKARVTMTQGDIFEGLEGLVKSGRKFDVVGVLGIFYHIMDHYRLLKLVCATKPKLIIVDNDFWIANYPMIGLMRENTGKHLNTTAHVAGQEIAPVGYVSRPALELMAETLGYRVEWSDWSQVPVAERAPVADYFREKTRRRNTCALRPI